MKTIPPNHQLVMTQDGSATLFSMRFQENCHSTSGAKTETILHYLDGCEILTKASSLPHLTILEVGFGLGVGFLMTEETLRQAPTSTFLSLEIDEELLEWFRLENLNDPFLGKLKWKNSERLKWLEAQDDKLNLIILCGDARGTLPHFLNRQPIKWNAIYQDAFSPKKNPTLWTQEWFQLLKNNAAEDVVLSTYSASSSIRKALAAAGWKLFKGEQFGPKRSSTRAKLAGESDPEIMLNLSRSPVPVLTDDNIESFLSQ